MTNQGGRRGDPIGLRTAQRDRLLIAVVAAMSFLATLAMAGSVGASGLAQHWLAGARTMVTIVPDPSMPVQQAGSVTRIDAVLTSLREQPTLSGVRILSSAELGAVLKPWLGDAGTSGMQMPGVILAQGDAQVSGLGTALRQIAPGTLIERGGRLTARLMVLSESLQAAAAAIMVIVAAVAASVVGVSVQAGLAQRREAIESVHGLGARDRDIAHPFARQIARQAALGGLVGGVAALPVLFGLERLAAGLTVVAPGGGAGLAPALWAAPLLLMGTAAFIGWAVAEITVLRWLRRLS